MDQLEDSLAHSRKEIGQTKSQVIPLNVRYRYLLRLVCPYYGRKGVPLNLRLAQYHALAFRRLLMVIPLLIVDEEDVACLDCFLDYFWILALPFLRVAHLVYDH